MVSRFGAVGRAVIVCNATTTTTTATTTTTTATTTTGGAIGATGGATGGITRFNNDVSVALPGRVQGVLTEEGLVRLSTTNNNGGGGVVPLSRMIDVETKMSMSVYFDFLLAKQLGTVPSKTTTITTVVVATTLATTSAATIDDTGY